MRLLPDRHDHGGCSTAQGQAEANRRGYQPRDYEYLSMRDLPAGPRSHPRRCERVKREVLMNYVPHMDRRAFVVGAAAAGGLALGFDIPLGGPKQALAQDGSPEINAWVVVRPDDTVVIRVA